MIQGKTLTLMAILCWVAIAESANLGLISLLNGDTRKKASGVAGNAMGGGGALGGALGGGAGGALGGLLGGGDSGLAGLIKKLLQALGLAPKDPAPSVPGVPLPVPSGLPSVPAGVPSVPAGVPSVPAGVPSLPAGVPSVPAGVPSLPAGVPSLPAGVPSVPAAPLPAVPAAPASPLSGLLSGLPLGDQATIETADLVEQVQMLLENLLGKDGRSLGPVKGVKSVRGTPSSGAGLGGLLGDAESGRRFHDQAAIETADLVEQVQMLLENLLGKDGRSLGSVKGVKNFRTSKSGATALGGALGGLLGGGGLLG